MGDDRGPRGRRRLSNLETMDASMLMTKNGVIKAAAVSSAASLTLILTLGAAGAAHAQTIRPGTTLALPCAANFDSTACGALSRATGENTTALGAGAEATVFNSVAIGTLSVTDRESTVSVGRVGEERQIVNVADGTEATDAVNLGQMEAGDATTLTAANTYTDVRETAVRTDMAAGDAATLAAANAYSDAGDAATLTAANTYADAGDAATLAAATSYADAGDAATLVAANDYTDTRETAMRGDMAAGDAATLASANTHADAGDVRTLASANTYADAGDIRTLGAANFYTDQQFTRLETVMNGRFHDVEVRMDQVTAMSAAFAVMAGNNAGAGTGSANRLVVGVGNYGSETAMSVGYSRAISNRTAFNAGVSFTGGEVMSGGSFGFAW